MISPLLLLASLSLTSLAQFSHFPPVTARSDNVPPPEVEVRPTGRPGLLDLHQREELLALLTAPVNSPEPESGARPRQKMTQKMTRMAEIVTPGSRSRISPPLQSRARTESPQITTRKLKFSGRRFRNKEENDKMERHENAVNVDDDGSSEQNKLRSKFRGRNRNGISKTATKNGGKADRKKTFLNRKKIVKQIQAVEESGPGLLQRRIRVKPSRKNHVEKSSAILLAEDAVDKDTDGGRQFQRRLRPLRLKENKEDGGGLAETLRLNAVSRSRAGSKDRDDRRQVNRAVAAANKYEIEPQRSTLRPVNTSSRPTIESLNIDPRRYEQREQSTVDQSGLTSSDSTTLKIPQTTEIQTIPLTTLTTEKGFSFEAESFLPTIRNIIAKKSRKRFRKVKTNSKSPRRRLNGENEFLIDGTHGTGFREKLNRNRDYSTTTTLVNLITTTTTLVNLITSAQSVPRKNLRARGGIPNQISAGLRETTTITPVPTTKISTTTEALTTTTTTEPPPPTTTTTTSTAPPTTTTTTTTIKYVTDDFKVSTTATSTTISEESTTIHNPHKSRFSLRRNEITGGGEPSPHSPVSYDLEKALRHAEITWQQDPFRRTTGLPGRPSFDIDFSKNPGSHTSQSTKEQFSGFPPVRSVLVPTPAPSRQTRRKISAEQRHSAARPSPPQTSSGDLSRKPLESLLWTPALLRTAERS